MLYIWYIYDIYLFVTLYFYIYFYVFLNMLYIFLNADWIVFEHSVYALYYTFSFTCICIFR